MNTKCRKGGLLSRINYERLSTSEYDEEPLKEARKGYVPVLVGCEGDEKEEIFFLRLKMLKEPSIMKLFQKAAEEFGYRQEGILRIPCCVEQFRRILDGKENDFSGHA